MDQRQPSLRTFRRTAADTSRDVKPVGQWLGGARPDGLAGRESIRQRAEFDGRSGPKAGAARSPPAALRPESAQRDFPLHGRRPSQVDTFDPKPRLQKESGQPFKMKMEPTQFNDNGLTLGSPWSFRNYGQCGLPVSDLFPRVGECADELCVIRSMVSDFSEHTNANYFLHTGLGLSGRPSMGAWVGYGLGSENQDLPGFVVLNGGLVPPGGLENFGSGFLPATFQGSILRAGPHPLANIRPAEPR